MTVAAQRLLAPEVPPWAQVRSMVLLGRRVNAVVGRVDDECERRARLGLGALDDRGLLRALFELPVGLAVPAHRLDRPQRRVLARAPAGLVARQRGYVTRLASPPVRVEMVIVRERDWRRGLFDASQFGPFCRRVLTLSREPSDVERLEMEARLYGVGVVITEHDEGELLVAPSPFVPQRHTSARWLFQERAYAQLDDGGLGVKSH